MNKLSLNVPPQDATRAPLAEWPPRRLDVWLDALPMANVEQTADRILEFLHQTNRGPLDPVERFRIMEQLRPVATSVVDSLKPKYATSAFPLAPRDRAGALAVKRTLEEMSYGCKIVVADILSGPIPTSRDRERILWEALINVTSYLAQLLLESYLLYESEAQGLWQELHQIYLFAEQPRSFAITTQDQTPVQTSNAPLIHIYKRIALLALANPYHLMQGEANTVYGLLDRWAAACRIMPCDAAQPVGGKFFIDLAVDAPPRYAPRNTGFRPAQGRILEISPLIEALGRRVKEISLRESTAADTIALTLAERMERDMLLRLERAWGARTERQTPRAPRLSQVQMAVGLSAVHHFVSGRTPFTPEQDEIRFHTGRHTTKKGPELSLLPKEYEPWKSEEEEARLKHGILKPRTSRFDANDNERDVWMKIFSAPSNTSAVPAQDAAEPAYASSPWRQKNESPGGLSLFCNKDCRVRVRVGELVALKSADASEDAWRVGAIRWLRMQAEDVMEMGIMILCDDARAVAVRSVKGAGKGGEYFRGLLAPGHARADPAATLVTPASIYDVDTVLAVNQRTELFYARLTALLEPTKSFSQFSYQIVDVPESEREKIALLKRNK